MPWQTPVLQDLVTQAIRSFAAYLPGADAALRRNNLNPVAKVIAGTAHGIYGYADWIARGRFVITADAEFLDRHGAQMKPAVPRRQPQVARGLASATSAIGGVIPTGSALTRSDGVVFFVEYGVSLVASVPASLSLVASEAGIAGNTDAGAVFSSVDVPDAVIEVSAGGLGGGAALEDDESYRQRLLFAKAFPEHAGAPPDWLRYTLAVAGVTRAYIDPLGAGRGTVVVYPFFDLSRANGIPLDSDRVIVQGALDLARPGAGLPVVKIAVPVPVPITVASLSPDAPDVRQAIATEIAATFARQARVSGFAEAHPSMPFLATPQTFSRSWIWQAISNATGESSHILQAPTADLVLSEGEIAVPGAITFV